MNGTYEKIIKEGQAAGKTCEQINAELKAAGANFHLAEDGRIVDPGEGFIDQPAKTEEVRRELDRSPRPDLAGQTVEQHIAGATYRVTYNADGTFKVAHKI